MSDRPRLCDGRDVCLLLVCSVFTDIWRLRMELYIDRDGLRLGLSESHRRVGQQIDLLAFIDL